MKNAVSYFYNIIIDDIHQISKRYYFDYQNYRYFLEPYNDIALIQDIYNLHLYLISSGIYVHQIIKNKNNNLITLIDGTPYVLLKAKYYKNKANYSAILAFINILIPHNLLFSKNNYSLNRSDWANLWSEKNDYLEYQMSQLGQKHKILCQSFSYYVGLGETAIQLVGLLSGNHIKVIAHKRVAYDIRTFDLYNPLNLIIDSRTRDVAEYLKNKFFNGQDINSELNYFLTNVKLSDEEYLLFLARMLYPTYYFDVYEDIISGKKKGEEIKKITSLANDYEKILKSIYRFCKSKVNFQPIEWLD